MGDQGKVDLRANMPKIEEIANGGGNRKVRFQMRTAPVQKARQIRRTSGHSFVLERAGCKINKTQSFRAKERHQMKYRLSSILGYARWRETVCDVRLVDIATRDRLEAGRRYLRTGRPKGVALEIN